MRVPTIVAAALLAAFLPQSTLAEKTVTGSAAPVATLELASEQMRLIQGGTAGRSCEVLDRASDQRSVVQRPGS